MDHQRVHDQIIKRAKEEKRIKFKGIYYENHHIIPRCLGGKDNKSNMVLLTAREHFIVHKLLTYVYPEHNGIAMAFHMISTDKNEGRKVSARDYEYARELMREAVSGKNNGNYKAKPSKEQLDKMYQGRLKYYEKLREQKKLNEFFTPNVKIGRRKLSDEEREQRKKEHNKNLVIKQREKRKKNKKMNPRPKRIWTDEEKKAHSKKVIAAMQRPEEKSRREAHNAYLKSPEGRKHFSNMEKNRIKGLGELVHRPRVGSCVSTYGHAYSSFVR